MKTLTLKKALISSGLVTSLVASSISPVLAQTVSPSPMPSGDLRRDFRDIRNDTPGPEKRHDIRDFKQDFQNAAKIFGGTVNAITGSTLTVSFNSQTFTVLTDSSTHFRRHFFGKSELTEISVNDKVDVLGKFTDSTKTTIQARVIRDASIMRRHGVLFGTVTSKSNTGFVLQTKNRGSVTVTPVANTKYFDRNGAAITFSQLAANNKVRVQGIWDLKSKQLTEVDTVKDFSIPAQTTGTPTVTK